MEIPREIKDVLNQLEEAGYEAYIVGGCVRDLLMSRKPKDWDIATIAKPAQIQKVFKKSFYENKFGTVTVQTESKEDTLREVEITTYRLDDKYTDKRHPDKVSFSDSLKQDLARRDFTVNAMALGLEKELTLIKSAAAHNLGDWAGTHPGIEINIAIIDPYDGQHDLRDKIIKAVGDPEKRFSEDALRMIRAIRIATELDFKIEPLTFKAIQGNAGWLQAVAKERIRDELIRIIMSSRPDKGIELLRESSLLQYVIPELAKGVGVTQNKHHIYTIYQHSILSLKAAAQKNFNLEIRLASLFHDIAKPQTKQGQGEDATFYNHDSVGAKFAVRILSRLCFPKKIIEHVAVLVRYHMFVYNVDEVTETGVRRLLRRVGPKNIDDLINLRIADRIGSGVPKAEPYKLRHLKYVIEKVSKDPISVKMLKIDGNSLMKILNMEPGPRIGLVLDALLSEVLEDPKKNEKQYLETQAKELNKFSDEKLKNKNKKIKEKKEEEDLKIKKRYWVK